LGILAICNPFRNTFIKTSHSIQVLIQAPPGADNVATPKGQRTLFDEGCTKQNFKALKRLSNEQSRELRRGGYLTKSPGMLFFDVNCILSYSYHITRLLAEFGVKFRCPWWPGWVLSLCFRPILAETAHVCPQHDPTTRLFIPKAPPILLLCC